MHVVKKARKVKSDKSDIPPIPVNGPLDSSEIFLSREDQKNLEDATNSAEKAKLSMHLAEQVVVNKKLELQIVNNDLESAKRNLLVKSGDYENKAKQAGLVINSLKIKHKISGDFQYEPLSGKVLNAP